MHAKQHMKKLKKIKSIATLFSTFAMKSKLMQRLSVNVMPNMIHSWKISKWLVQVNAGKFNFIFLINYDFIKNEEICILTQFPLVAAEYNRLQLSILTVRLKCKYYPMLLLSLQRSVEVYCATIFILKTIIFTQKKILYDNVDSHSLSILQIWIIRFRIYASMSRNN